jgi:hypothetical protein
MKRNAIGLAALLMLALLAWRMKPNASAALEPAAPVQTLTAAPSAPSESATEIPKQPAPSRLSERAPASDAQASAAPPPTEILVRGTVIEEHGQPVPKATLGWLDDQGQMRVTAVQDGAYALAGMHPGHYLVWTSGTGWRQDQLDAVLDEQPGAQERDFRAHSNPQVLIRVCDTSGAALVGKDADGYANAAFRLRAYASRNAPGSALEGEQLRSKASSDCGFFRTRWETGSGCTDCVGVLELYEDPPLCISFVLGASVIATRRIESVPSELVFTLAAEDLHSRLATLRMRLLKPDGKSPSTGTALLQADTLVTRSLDPEGRAEFSDLVPGGYTLNLHCPGSARQERRLVLEAGQVLDLGEITPASASKQSVRFVFPSKEQPEVQFVLQPVIAGRPLEMLAASDGMRFSSQAGNPVEIGFPGPGTYELRVTEVGAPRGSDSLHLAARPERVVLADQPAGELLVRIVSTTDVCLRPPAGSRGVSRWLVSTAEGLPCQRVRIQGRAPMRAELAAGEYTIARFDPETKELGKEQAFIVGSEPVSVELRP